MRRITVHDEDAATIGWRLKDRVAYVGVPDVASPEQARGDTTIGDTEDEDHA